MRTFRDFLVMEETRKEYGELIRDALKKAGYKVPKEVTVKTSRTGSYYVDIKTFAIDKKDIEKIVNNFEKVRYDERTNEILGGGNTFVFVNYDNNLYYKEKERLKKLEEDIIQKIKDNEGHMVKLNNILEIELPSNTYFLNNKYPEIYLYKLKNKNLEKVYYSALPIWQVLAKAGF